MRICPKCNLIIDNDSAKFCRKCGTKLPDIQPIESSEPEIIAEPEQELHQAQDDSNAIIEPQTDEYNELEAQSDSQSDSISFYVETTNEPVHEDSLDQPEIVNISPMKESSDNLEEEQNTTLVGSINDQPVYESKPIDTVEQHIEVSQHAPSTIDYAKAWKIIIASSVALLVVLVVWMLPPSVWKREWQQLTPDFSMSTPIQSVRVDMNDVENDASCNYFITFSEYSNSPGASITGYSVCPYENTIFDANLSYYTRYNITDGNINGYGGNCIAVDVGDGIYEYTFSRPVYFSFNEHEVNAPYHRIKVKLANEY